MSFKFKLCTLILLIGASSYSWSAKMGMVITSQLSANVKIKFLEHIDANEVRLGYMGAHKEISWPSDNILHVTIFEPQRTVHIDCVVDSPAMQIGIIDRVKNGRHTVPVYGCFS